MKIQTYEDMSIKWLDRTPIASNIVKLACDLTMKKTDDISEKTTSVKLARHLVSAEHTSVFEHANISLLVTGISRSLLAQVTRQRTFSFTSASQHYQDYRDYPVSLRQGWDDYDMKADFSEKAQPGTVYSEALEHALNSYIELINLGEKPEEARQVLPNACTVNLIITANARAIALFLRQRLCRRNTLEMRIFAEYLREVCVLWFPELFCQIAAPCTMDGICNQGKLKCSKKP